MNQSNEFPLLSVVIPAYNASASIKKTLDSLVHQTVEHALYRVIVVDDGSTDDTLSKCLKFAEQYENIFVLSKENGGVSSARNIGIEHAVGRWVTFVDSDDFVTEDYVEAVTTVSPESSYVIFDHYENDINRLSSEKRWMRLVCEKIHPMSEVLKWICDQRLNCPWDKRYDLDTIRNNGLRFKEGIHMGEDFLFNFEYAIQGQDVFVSNRAIYVYVDNANGLCRKRVSRSRLSEFEIIYACILGRLSKFADSEQYIRPLNLSFLRNVFLYAGQLKISGYSNREIQMLFNNSEMVRSIMTEKTVDFKYLFRKAILKTGFYKISQLLLLRK